MIAKRVFDLVSSVIGLVVLAPILVLVSLFVWLGDRGPVFFRQERVGRGGRLFRIHKFRTMRVANSGSQVTSADDDRITPIGKVLRKTKLDELPQLIDVALGDMSLVGPRPEVPRYVELWGEEARTEILSVRPGITDPAAIAYRNEQDELAAAEDPEEHYTQVILPRKVAMYCDYVRNRSFTGDIKIILGTIAAVFRS